MIAIENGNMAHWGGGGGERNLIFTGIGFSKDLSEERVMHAARRS